MSKSSVYSAITTMTANGNSAAVDLSSLGTAFQVDIYFGTGVTFDSGSLQLQASPDGGTTWLAVPGATAITTATANSYKASYSVYAGTQVRFALTGVVTASVLNPVIRATSLRYETTESFALTANGDTASFVLRDVFKPIGWAAFGTWGSGTLTLKVSPDGGTTWFALDSATANALKHTTNTAEEMLCKFTLAGATTPSLSIRVYG